MAATAKRRDRFITRKTAAAIVTEQYFPITKRGLEKWPLSGRLINGKVHLSEAAVRAHAQAMIDQAPATSVKFRKDR